MQKITFAFNAIAGDVAHEPMIGTRLQNILGMIPIINFVVAGGRIAHSVKHIQALPVDAKFLTTVDKQENANCKRHIARGVVELIPGAGALFLLPDIFFLIIRAAIGKNKNQNQMHKQFHHSGHVKINVSTKRNTPQEQLRCKLYKSVEDLRNNHYAIRRLIKQTQSHNAPGFEGELRKFITQHFEILKTIDIIRKDPLAAGFKNCANDLLAPISENGVNASFQNDHSIQFSLPSQSPSEEVQNSVDRIMKAAFTSVKPPEPVKIYLPEPEKVYYNPDGW